MSDADTTGMRRLDRDGRWAHHPTTRTVTRALPAGATAGRAVARAGQPRGYALAVTVLVMFIVTVLSSLAVLAATTDTLGARATAQRSDGRTLATSALNEFYAGMVSTAYLTDVRALILTPDLAEPAHPALRGRAHLIGGSPVAVADPDAFAEDSYALEVQFSDATECLRTGTLFGPDQDTTVDTCLDLPRNVLLVQVTTWTGCDSSGEQRETSCTRTRFQQRVRSRAFFDFLYFHEYSALDPASPGWGGIDFDDRAACADLYGLTARETTPADPADPADPAGEEGPRSREEAPDCLEIAYHGDPGAATDPSAGRFDIIRGPVFTNDDYIVVCGSPQFVGPVYVAGSGWRDPDGTQQVFRSAGTSTDPTDPADPADPAGPVDPSDRTGGGCDPAESPRFDAETLTEQPELRLPETTTSARDFCDLATPRLRLTPADPTVPVSVTLDADTSDDPSDTAATVDTARGTGLVTYATITGSTSSDGRVRLVDGAVIYAGPDPTCTTEVSSAPARDAAGNDVPHPTWVDLDISGEVAGRVSVFATGDIHVSDDLTYAGMPAEATDVSCGDRDVVDLTGLTARGAIIVDQVERDPADLGAPQTDLRRLHAVLLSIERSPYTDGWNVPRWDEGGAPTLEFCGAMASKYQGVFGGYDTDSGLLLSGYRKDFYFDTRLTNGLLQPPFLLSPDGSLWQRLDIIEVASCTGLRQTTTAGPAGDGVTCNL